MSYWPVPVFSCIFSHVTSIIKNININLRIFITFLITEFILLLRSIWVRTKAKFEDFKLGHMKTMSFLHPDY